MPHHARVLEEEALEDPVEEIVEALVLCPSLALPFLLLPCLAKESCKKVAHLLERLDKLKKLRFDSGPATPPVKPHRLYGQILFHLASLTWWILPPAVSR